MTELDKLNALVTRWIADMSEDHDGHAAHHTEYVLVECDGEQCPHAAGDALMIERVIVIVRRIAMM
jgi:hypothetical protein